MDNMHYLLSVMLSYFEHERNMYNTIMKSSPEGRLFTAKRKGKTLYFHAIRIGAYKSGTYKYRKKVISNDRDALSALVEKEYARVALEIIEQNIRAIQTAIPKVRELSFESIRSGMGRVYQELPDDWFPMVQRNSCIISEREKWAAGPYEQSNYLPHEKIHTTSRGLKVRSRAELLIAEMLYRYDIPFRYEQVVRAGRYELAPDFTFLDSFGNEFYWEYCGMMSDPHYLKQQLWRRGMYESIGITEWNPENTMIYTYDALDSIDMREIEIIIKTKILPRLQAG